MDDRQCGRRQFGRAVLRQGHLVRQRQPGSPTAPAAPTATAPTVGTPPAWRRARTTSAATSTRAASRRTPTSPSRSPSRPPRPRPSTLTAPTSGSFTAGQTVPIQWTAANVAAGSTIALCYDKGTAFSNVTWITFGQAGANGNGSLQLEHHRRAGGHVLHRRLSLLRTASRPTPTSPSRSPSPRR